MEPNLENIARSPKLPSKKKPLRNVLKSTLIFKCETCQKAFEKKTNLVRHMKTMHPGLFHSEYGKQLSELPDFLHDMRQENNEASSYDCIDCSESFTTKNEFQCHKKTHKGRPSVYCEQCSQTFAYKKDLKTHMKEVHKAIPRLTNEPPVIIPSCVVTDEGKSVTIFRCNLCSRAFNLKTDLLRHFLIHSGEKPFNCDICESRFNRRSNLLRHRRSMHNVIDDTEAFRYRKSDLRQRKYQNREIWQIESEAIAEEERIIREQEHIDKQRCADARMHDLMLGGQFSDNEDVVEEDDDDTNCDDFSTVLIEPDDIPKSGVELSLLQPDEKITVRILTFDN